MYIIFLMYSCISVHHLPTVVIVITIMHSVRNLNPNSLSWWICF